MTEETLQPLPIPVPSIDNQAFWEACNRGELVIQHCPRCDVLRHPPRPMCPGCRGRGLGWKKVSGLGTVYSYTVTHQAIHPSLRGRVPWTVIMVDLDEGVRMISHIVDCPAEDVRIGMRVEVVFEEVEAGVTLPYFCPAAD